MSTPPPDAPTASTAPEEPAESAAPAESPESPETPESAGPQQHGVDELVADEFNEVDSALSVPVSDSLTSLRSSIMNYQMENGRTYHAMSAGKYLFPNDDAEIERLDLQHHILKLTLDGDLCACPKKDGANRVLDLGAGTGIWCIDYADQYPGAEVVGVDLSPIQPGLIPPNCSFEVDDLEKDWMWTKEFDFIMARMVNGCFSDPKGIVQKAYNQLEPGGYFEVQDLASPMGCDDGTLTKDSDLWIWVTTVMKAMEIAQRPVVNAQQWKSFLEEVGFEDVVETVHKWPINTWPRDPKHKTLGRWCLLNTDMVVEPAILAPATRFLGWTREEALFLAAKARKVIRDPRVHSYWPVHVVYGRKPGKSPRST
ncbi:TAM domain methyltransferase [Chaetomium sp. MPI-CAGE-AT-0009]|nr:TAM domain methyltransferase [Chaetomium sp. MPI-CAGE-AT-0009]